MSLELIDRSTDLNRLRDEGYDVATDEGWLLVHRVPYIQEDGREGMGTLVMPLAIAEGKTATPNEHTAHWIGQHPCRAEGGRITAIEHSEQKIGLPSGAVDGFTFSAKASGGYTDFYHKVITYIGIITGEATRKFGDRSARVYPIQREEKRESNFAYRDTWSGREGISDIVGRTKQEEVVIIGVGGTGSYVLDLIAKAHVEKITLIDGDKLLQHNAFRMPGAATEAELSGGQKKVEVLQKRYNHIHRNISCHAQHLTEENLDILNNATTIFICVDQGSIKRCVFEYAERKGILVIDCGIGVYRTEDEQLSGHVRVTTANGEMRDHIYRNKRVDLSRGNIGEDEYRRNIQTAELNCLNATLAVLRWKRCAGIYRDEGREYHSIYTISGGNMINSDRKVK